MKTIELPEDYALVLQQVKETGEEDFANLAETLRIDRPRLSHILQGLQNKGLILVRRTTYTDAWVRLTTKGQRLMNFMWPEAAL